MVDVARDAAAGHLQRAAGNITHVNERPHARAAPLEPEFLAGEHAVHGPRDDPVERLPGAADVRRPRERDREPESLLIGQQIQIAGRLRHGVGCARVERGRLLHQAARAPVDLRRRDLHELLEKVHFPKPVHQPGRGHHVGLVPVLGVVPALGDHALGREVDHVFRPGLADQRLDPVEVAVEVEGVEREPLMRGPLVGEQRLVGFGRAADADHPGAVSKRGGDERRPRERVATKDDEGFRDHTDERGSRFKGRRQQQDQQAFQPPQCPGLFLFRNKISKQGDQTARVGRLHPARSQRRLRRTCRKSPAECGATLQQRIQISADESSPNSSSGVQIMGRGSCMSCNTE